MGNCINLRFVCDVMDEGMKFKETIIKVKEFKFKHAINKIDRIVIFRVISFIITLYGFYLTMFYRDSDTSFFISTIYSIVMLFGVWLMYKSGLLDYLADIFEEKNER